MGKAVVTISQIHKNNEPIRDTAMLWVIILNCLYEDGIVVAQEMGLQVAATPSMRISNSIVGTGRR